jgi:tetratricopeptide (TPR) repeat protein
MSDVEDASWADGEVSEAETSASAAHHELVDFSEVRARVEDFLQQDADEQAYELLDQMSRWPDSTRYLEDNVWLYETLGRLQYAAGQAEEALSSFERAFELEPRQLSLLETYADLLFETDEFEQGLRVVQSLLLHHKRSLEPQRLAAIYRRLGLSYEALEHYEKSRTAFEKALENDGGDQQSLTGLLRVVGHVADPMEVIRVRQKLVRSLDDERARSMALVALGDDWVNEFNDPGRAIDVYDQAIREDRSNTVALERIARVGAEAGDWRRVARAYFDLAEITDEPDQRADWIMRASIVARDELWESDKALKGFRTVLDLDPTRLDAFKAVTSILVDSKKWDDLEEAYLGVITANVEAGNDDPKLLAVLWQKLGDLYKNYLSRVDDAIFAYDQAAERLPDNIHLHAAVANHAEVSEDHYDKAVLHLREMMRLSQDDASLLERLGKVYMRMKKLDRALCVYRVLDHAGHPLDENAKGFVDRFDTAMFRPVETALNPSVLKRYVYHESLDAQLNRLFSALKVGLDEWVGESTSKYGLKRRDRVKLDEPLAFNNIYKSIGKSLGWNELPQLWHKPDQEGLINAALVPEGLIAGDALLGSGREEYMAFIIAKQLFLFLRPFYLAAIRPPTDLHVFFILAAAHIRPDLEIEMTKDRESAMKAIRKRIKGKDFEMLKGAIDALSQREVDLNGWVEAVEDSANRVGLIFSDDLDACREYLAAEPKTIGSRSVDERMSALLSYAVSESFMDLREQVGVAIAS